MKKLLFFVFIAVLCSNIWAGFSLENFNDATAWAGYTINTNYPYYNLMTFNGNEWKFYDVVQYNSGSDYELEIRHAGPGPGKISSHQFTNGAGTLTFNAYYVDNPGKVHVYYSENGNNWTNAVYDKSINTSSSSPYSVVINNSQAKYIRFQSSTSLINKIRIDDIELSNYIVPELPTVVVASASNITKFTAQCGGTVTNDGGAEVTARGVCWSTQNGPNLSNCGDNYTIDGIGTGLFQSQLTGLSANTLYYVRAYATNSVGTAYSEFNFQTSFTTQNHIAPSVTTNEATNINHMFAKLNGVVNGDEAETTVVFEYGLTDNYGSEITADQSPLLGAGNQSVQAALHGMNEYTTYHYRVKATNVIGTTYGDDKTFTTTNNPNQTSTQSIPVATPDPDPIEFTGTGVTIDFSGVSGATGANDITVSKYNETPTNLGGLIGSEVNVAGTSFLFTNLTGFSFTSTLQFLISELPSVNLALFSDYDNGTPTDIRLWKRPEYGTGDFVDQGYLLYNKGADFANVTSDDYLYLEGITSFSEITFTSDEDHPLPVTLSSFTAGIDAGLPVLWWTTESEQENMGWNLYRSNEENGINANNFLKLNETLIPGMGTTTQPTSYFFVDEHNIAAPGAYWYWLQSVSFSGELEMFGPVSLQIGEGGIPDLPQYSSLQANYPNPFNPVTTIEFSIREGDSGTMAIYNIAGQKILVKDFPAGNHLFHWNADDQASGVYLYQLKTPSYNKINKALLLK
jgi:hypothetical protein